MIRLVPHNLAWLARSMMPARQPVIRADYSAAATGGMTRSRREDNSGIKVDFLIAGVQKGGTSSLNAYLRPHPQIGVASVKEVHFFDDERFFDSHQVDYTKYQAFFGARSGVLYGEATPNYTYWTDATRRVWEYNPEMKWIVLLRDPIERAYSHWRMIFTGGRDNLEFGDAIRRERERCREALPLQHKEWSYVDRGYYSEQIRRIWRFFPANQTLFLKSENFFAKPDDGLAAVCEFLGVEKRRLKSGDVVNEGEKLGDMAPADRAFLKDIYRSDVLDVESLLGWNCDDWLA